MANVADEHNASREWVTKRLNELATAKGITVETVEFATDPEGFGDILVARAQGRREAEKISSVTLDDLTTDAGEQAQMDLRLRDVVRRLKTGH
jgi:hypothetical protein